MTPTARSLEWLRNRGNFAATVETWIHKPKEIKCSHCESKLQSVLAPQYRKDLFGWADILSFGPDGFLFVQATDDSSVSKRRLEKADGPALEEWLRRGGRLEIHGWKKRPVQGKKGVLMRWSPRIVPVTMDGMPARTLAPQPQPRAKRIVEPKRELQPVLF